MGDHNEMGSIANAGQPLDSVDEDVLGLGDHADEGLIANEPGLPPHPHEQPVAPSGVEDVPEPPLSVTRSNVSSLPPSRSDASLGDDAAAEPPAAPEAPTAAASTHCASGDDVGGAGAQNAAIFDDVDDDASQQQQQQMPADSSGGAGPSEEPPEAEAPAPAQLLDQEELLKRTSMQRVRTACKACHVRKLRCRVTDTSGNCSNCIARGEPCEARVERKRGRPRSQHESSADYTQRGLPRGGSSGVSPWAWNGGSYSAHPPLFGAFGPNGYGAFGPSGYGPGPGGQPTPAQHAAEAAAAHAAAAHAAAAAAAAALPGGGFPQQLPHGYPSHPSEQLPHGYPSHPSELGAGAPMHPALPSPYGQPPSAAAAAAAAYNAAAAASYAAYAGGPTAGQAPPTAPPLYHHVPPSPFAYQQHPSLPLHPGAPPPGTPGSAAAAYDQTYAAAEAAHDPSATCAISHPPNAAIGSSASPPAAGYAPAPGAGYAPPPGAGLHGPRDANPHPPHPGPLHPSHVALPLPVLPPLPPHAGALHNLPPSHQPPGLPSPHGYAPELPSAHVPVNYNPAVHYMYAAGTLPYGASHSVGAGPAPWPLPYGAMVQQIGIPMQPGSVAPGGAAESPQGHGCGCGQQIGIPMRPGPAAPSGAAESPQGHGCGYRANGGGDDGGNGGGDRLRVHIPFIDRQGADGGSGDSRDE